MLLYRIAPNGMLDEVSPRSFSDPEIALKERQDLQQLFLNSPTTLNGILGKPVKVIAEEFDRWEESKRRIDLLAIDKTGQLIVIELKRDEDGAHMELQAIRYAAMVASLDFSGVVEVFGKLLEKLGKDKTQAENELLEFLDGTDEGVSPSIGSRPSIVLISRGFGKELTTTALWLRGFNLDIQCIEVRPYLVAGEKLVGTSRIIPLPQAQEYIEGIAKKAEEAELKAKRNRLPQVVPFLVERNVLKPNDRLFLLKKLHSSFEVPADQKSAIYLGSNRVRWEFDGQEYSLSALCEFLYHRYTGGRSSLGGPSYWAIEGQQETLFDVAKRLYQEGSGSTPSIERDAL